MYNRYLVVARKDNEDIEQYWDRLKTTIMCLLENDYTLIVTKEIDFVIRLDFTATDPELGDDVPYMLSEDEVEALELYKENHKEEE